MGGGDNELIIKTILDSTGFTKGSKQLLRAMNGLTNSIKSLFGRIVGVASVFGVISKAVSTFMSQNQLLTKQMDAAWTALGNALGPIITQIVEWVTKAVSYLVTLMKLLGFTSKTASQASKAARSAAGSLQRTVAGFDELNKLSSGGGSGAGTLKDIDPDVFLTKLTELLKSHLWRQAGELIAKKINELVSKIDAKKIAEKLSNAIKAILEFLIGFIGGLDTRQIGAKIRDFFTNIDWEGIATRIFELLKTAWNKALDLLWGLIAGESEEEPPLVASLRRLGEAIEKFVQAVEPIIENLWNNVLKPFAEWLMESAFPKILDEISKMLEDLAGLLSGKLTFSDFVKNMSLAEGAVIGLGTAIGLIKLGSFISAVQTLSSASVLGKLIEVFALTSQGAGTLKESISLVFPQMEKLITTVEGAITALGGLTGILGVAVVGLSAFYAATEISEQESQYLAEAFDGLGDSSEDLAVGVQRLADAANKTQEDFNNLVECGGDLTMAEEELAVRNSALREGYEMLADSLGITTDELMKQIEAADGNISAIEALKQHTGEAAQAADEAAKFNNQATQEMSEGYATLASNVETSTSEISGATATNTSEAANALESATSQMVANVDGSFSDMTNDVASAMSNMSATVDNGFASVVYNASNWGSDLIANFVSGIRAAIPYLADNMAMVAQIVRNYLGFSEPKKGPLSDFHTYGPDMMDLYAKGIQSESAKVYSAVNDVAEGVADGLAQSPLSMSAVASGSVVPYGVTGGVETSAAPNDGVSLTEVRDILTEIRNLLGTMEFVAQFGDLRAVAQRITTIQKQMERSMG